MAGDQRAYVGLSAAALAVLLWWQASQLTMGATLVWSLLFLVVFSIGVFGAAMLLARDGCQQLCQHTELLVPVALLALALSLVDVIGLATPLFTVRLGFVSVPISIAWMLRILVSGFFAAWTTLLVVDAVHRNRADLAGTLSRSWRCFPRIFLFCCLGWSVWMLLFAVEIPVLLGLGLVAARVLGRLGAAVAWVLVLGVLMYRFVISLATAALLPVAAISRESLWTTLRLGIATSWQYRGRWWMLLLAQYALVGSWATVGLRSNLGGGLAGNHTDVNIHFWYYTSWLADYAYAAQWYTTLMRWLEQEPILFVTTVWASLSAVLSIIIKLAIVRRLADADSTHADDLSDRPLLGERMSQRSAMDPA